MSVNSTFPCSRPPQLSTRARSSSTLTSRENFRSTSMVVDAPEPPPIARTPRRPPETRLETRETNARGGATETRDIRPRAGPCAPRRLPRPTRRARTETSCDGPREKLARENVREARAPVSEGEQRAIRGTPSAGMGYPSGRDRLATSTPSVATSRRLVAPPASRTTRWLSTRTRAR